jgi:hypothetical protein
MSNYAEPAARDILGHSTTKITEQRYIAPIPEADRKGPLRLEERVEGTQQVMGLKPRHRLLVV